MRCPRCLVRRCLCADIPAVDTSVDVVILRHTLERHRHSNSARWAALALSRCTVVEHGGRDSTVDAGLFVRPGTWLVYPGDGPPLPPGPPERLLFLDGSWSQARRMLQRVPGLAVLPRLSLGAGDPVRLRLRRAQAGGLATLEAIAAALAFLGDAEAATRLDALYTLAVARAYPAIPLVARHSSC